ncbi:ATP synthase F0 subcomplex B subunit [Caminicella sporogenes DSM 14501]|uniref:ATP synthase subunit b n=1 Tax=Caminicella sporogenes DSM 14501 TaxID=1121266 RepID=A0A1M6PTW6_9FIRM|nr:F0F1 ATP synthase subunit B [Caminicella sporogenes]RKD21978.1 ATP synthase F0 subunit B [Caminicella sporogenes]SHK11355.1 ATP synthase F0 subcomplex B subunit [Caminicella sporogenes DSM 14501]
MLRAGLVQLDWTFVFQIINTFILYLILKKLLFKPVTEFMASRQEGIKKSLEEAALKNKEADEKKEEYLTKIRGAEEEGRQIIKDASKRAEERANEIIKTAQKEADEIKERARIEIEREKEKAINSLKDEITSIAMLAASKVIEKDLDENSHKTLVKEFIDKVGETRWQN